MKGWTDRLVACAIAGATGLAGAAAPASAGEWPSWRGPHQNGVADDTELVASWSPAGENLVWRADFTGRSTPVVLDGRVCVTGRVGDGVMRQEIVACYAAADGRKLWEHRFNVYNTTVPFNRVGWASPVFDPETGTLYVHGVAGQLTAHDRDGKVLWSRFLGEEVGHLTGYGGRTQTPLVDGDQVVLSFVNSGWGEQAAPRHRVFSFDKRTGDILWVATPGVAPYDMNTQTNPVVAEIAGRRLIVTGNADGWVYALDASTGDKVWGFQVSRQALNVTPVVAGTRVFISHSEENLDEATMGRLVCIDGTGTGDVTRTHEVWRLDELEAGFPSPAHHRGQLYVVDNSGNLLGIDAEKGTVLWRHGLGTVGKASPVIADGKLYVGETNGRFHILELGSGAPRQLDLDELTVEGGRYAEIYGSPAVAYGRVYFATEGGVYCLGNKERPLRVPERVGPTPAAPGTGEAARILIAPAEVLIRPEEVAAFGVRAFDAQGRPLGAGRAEWTLQGLAGKMDADGRFTPDRSAAFQAGKVSARVGALTASARVRVVADFPWVLDFEGATVGDVPPTWVGAKGKFEVQEREGGKVLVKPVREQGLLRNELYMGPSTASNYTIEADVMGGRHGRRMTDVGLIAGGYTLDLMGNAQKLQIRAWATSEDRFTHDAPFPWEPGRWYRMKLRVEPGKTRTVVRGKVWARDEPEPAAWTLAVEDPLAIAGGSPGLIGYSPADILYDNVKITRNEG
jgi:outer membrane protein assembly factor BamB